METYRNKYGFPPFKVIGKNADLKRFEQDCIDAGFAVSEANSYFRGDYEHCILPAYSYLKDSPENIKLQTLEATSYSPALTFNLDSKKHYREALAIVEEINRFNPSLPPKVDRTINNLPIPAENLTYGNYLCYFSNGEILPILGPLSSADVVALILVQTGENPENFCNASRYLLAKDCPDRYPNTKAGNRSLFWDMKDNIERISVEKLGVPIVSLGPLGAEHWVIIHAPRYSGK